LRSALFTAIASLVHHAVRVYKSELDRHVQLLCLQIRRRNGIVVDSKVKILAAESDLYVANEVRFASHHRLFTLAACRSAAATASLRTAR
jgi:hypothetical protein